MFPSISGSKERRQGDHEQDEQRDEQEHNGVACALIPVRRSYDARTALLAIKCYSALVRNRAFVPYKEFYSEFVGFFRILVVTGKSKTTSAGLRAQHRVCQERCPWNTWYVTGTNARRGERGGRGGSG